MANSIADYTSVDHSTANHIATGRVVTGREPSVSTGTRLASLDALRGIDMFWIIGASTVLQDAVKASRLEWLAWIPEQLHHAKWEGFHFIDLVFPLFLFMIGAAIPYSLGKRIARGDNRKQIYAHLVRRVAVLTFFGMLINGSLLSYDPEKFELTYSVLQMLALGYLVAAMLFLHLSLRWQLAATLAMLVSYWALLAFVPGPGHEIGRFREGCNLGDWITEALVGKWRGQQIGWILGILGHASTAMLGVFAGHLLRSGASAYGKVLWLAVLGVAGVAAGAFWSGWVAQRVPLEILGTDWREWPVWFPIIKVRWTSSYVLYAGGISYLLLSAFYLLIDVWGYRRWAIPFMAIGANSIFAYMAWGLGNSAFRRVSEVFLGGLQPYVGEWHGAIISAGAMATLWMMLGYMYAKKTFLRV